MGWDIRWASVIGLLLGLALVFLLKWKPAQQSLWSLLVILPVLFWAQGLYQEQTFLIRFTEEGVVVFYYALLGYALIIRNPYLVGIGIACCVLSRYGHLFWVPIYLLFAWKYLSKREALISACVALSIGLIFFIIPFAYENWDYFLSIPGEYPNYARSLWERHPDFFPTTLGVAKYFPASQVDLLHQFHLFSISVVPLIMFLLFFYFEKKGKWTAKLWGICSLKLTLTFFYNLIIVPVLYLFWVPTLISCLILAGYIYHWEKP